MILDSIGTYLASTGVGYSALGTDIFLSLAPSEPNSCLVIYEYAGLQPEHAMGGGAGGAVLRKPRIQVACRGEQDDYSTARTNAETVLARLDGLGPTTLSSVFFHSIYAVSEPSSYRDENERPVIVCNYEVQKRGS